MKFSHEKMTSIYDDSIKCTLTKTTTKKSVHIKNYTFIIIDNHYSNTHKRLFQNLFRSSTVRKKNISLTGICKIKRVYFLYQTEKNITLFYKYE